MAYLNGLMDTIRTAFKIRFTIKACYVDADECQPLNATDDVIIL